MANCFYNADILLPKFRNDSEKMSKWSTIACDQYTSEADYWECVEKKVCQCASTLRVTLPEILLEGETDSKIADINAVMNDYLDSVLECHPSSMIYVERKLRSGKVRRGLVGMLDLEEYDFNKGAITLIRATEGTVLSRIPPRVKIRKGASIELPHIMMLIDDPQKTVVEPISDRKDGLEGAYDFTLMQDSGSIRGWFVDGDGQRNVADALERLTELDTYNKKYGTNEKYPMLFAAGDGNHSLATAKAIYEELKIQLGIEKAIIHPARYALAEIVNIHDEALEFEPIYRVIFETVSEKLIHELEAYAKRDKGGKNEFDITVVYGAKEKSIKIEKTEHELAVGALQEFLDGYLEENEGRIDYIHGAESARELANGEGAVGFLFEGMGKNELFKSVIINGSLPRKTFSMGEADDKRFYLEARRITEQ